jgi:hypothetical protein
MTLWLKKNFPRLNFIGILHTDVALVNLTTIIYDLRFSKQWLWRMPSSGLLHCVALEWTNILEEHIASIKNRWGRRILVTLMMETVCSSAMFVLSRATWCNIPEDGILLTSIILPCISVSFHFPCTHFLSNIVSKSVL